MSLAGSVYDALKSVLTVETRLDNLSQSFASLSADVKATNDRLASRLEDHDRRLARLEGKFELIETTLGSRRRRLPKGGD